MSENTTTTKTKKSLAGEVTSARLYDEYKKIKPELAKELGVNINSVPRLQKIVINSGVGRAKDDKKLIEQVSNTIRKITGQEPVSTKAKQSVAGFKLRDGNVIGVMVTLRGDRMYEFLDRLINVVLPRLRDFHGVSAKAFDAQGNYSLGMHDQSVFPELTFEETANPHGLQVVMNIAASEPAHSRVLLEKLGMPFEKEAK